MCRANPQKAGACAVPASTTHYYNVDDQLKQFSLPADTVTATYEKAGTSGARGRVAGIASKWDTSAITDVGVEFETTTRPKAATP